MMFYIFIFVGLNGSLVCFTVVIIIEFKVVWWGKGK